MRFKKSLVSSVLASSVALVGCGSGSTEESAPHGLTSEPSPTSGETLDVTPLSTQVTGSRFVHHRTDIGDFTSPVDPITQPLGAFVVENGVKRPLTVQHATDGTFRILDAPPGEYFIQLDASYALATDSRSVNLDRYVLGRPDVARISTNPLPVTFSASNLAPAPDGARFWLISSNAGAVGDFYGPVPANVTQLTDAPFEYFDYMYGDMPIIDGAQGDWVSIHQMVEREGDGFTYTTVDRALVPEPFTLSADPAVPTVISGTFQPVPQQTVEFTWARSRFEAWRTHTHPQAHVSAAGHEFIINPTAWGDDAYYGWLGELMYAQVPYSATDISPRITFGNPYLSWGAAGNIYHRFPNPALLLPGTSQLSSNLLVPMLRDQRPLRDFTGTIAPRVSPPQALQVDAQSAWQPHTLASLTPHLTWQAPRIGTPSAYRVHLYRLYTLPYLPTITRVSSVARFLTGRTSLTVPPGVLQPGEHYVFRITAIVTPGVDYASQPFAAEFMIDVASADVVSSILTAPGTLLKLDAEEMVANEGSAPGESAESGDFGAPRRPPFKLGW